MLLFSSRPYPLSRELISVIGLHPRNRNRPSHGIQGFGFGVSEERGEEFGFFWGGLPHLKLLQKGLEVLGSTVIPG